MLDTRKLTLGTLTLILALAQYSPSLAYEQRPARPGSVYRQGPRALPTYAFACGGPEARATFINSPTPCVPTTRTLLDCPVTPGLAAGLHIAGFTPTGFTSFRYGTAGTCLPESVVAVVFNGTKGGSVVQLVVCCPDGSTPFNNSCFSGWGFTINTTTNPELAGLTVSSIDIVHPTQIVLGNGNQPQTVLNSFTLNGNAVGTSIDTTIRPCPPLPALPCAPQAI